MHTMTLDLILSPGPSELEAADTPTGRTLAGIVVPYGVPGNTSIGPVTVVAGTIALPADLARVKLVDEHRTPPAPIGYAIAATDTPAGLRMVFRVGNTPAGDAALLEASEHLRDAFSVELTDVILDRGGRVTASRLTAVALVTVPAFDAALVDGIAASQPNPTPAARENQNGYKMTEDQIARLSALRAMDSLTQAEANELAELTALEAVPAVEPAVEPAPPVAVAASLPAGLPVAGARRTARPIGDLYAAIARVASGVSRPQMEAALSDITNTANLWTARDDYAGQLWSGLGYSRRYVPLLTGGRLTSYKGTGWRWLVAPEVADYAGDKAAVTSNAATTEAVEYTAARLAGAHDLDRKFVDFGDSEFIAAYYAAMTESYAKQSDAKARAFIIASADSAGSAGAGSDLFDAALLAADTLDVNTDGASVDYVLVNSADRRALLSTTAADLPAFLDVFGIEPSKFIASTAVPAGTVIAGTRQAGSFLELSDTPIRVEAVNVANGGVDGGVFGYYATLLHHESAIVSATFGA